MSQNLQTAGVLWKTSESASAEKTACVQHLWLCVRSSQGVGRTHGVSSWRRTNCSHLQQQQQQQQEQQQCCCPQPLSGWLLSSSSELDQQTPNSSTQAVTIDPNRSVPTHLSGITFPPLSPGPRGAELQWSAEAGPAGHVGPDGSQQHQEPERHVHGSHHHLCSN